MNAEWGGVAGFGIGLLFDILWERGYAIDEIGEFVAVWRRAAGCVAWKICRRSSFG